MKTERRKNRRSQKGIPKKKVAQLNRPLAGTISREEFIARADKAACVPTRLRLREARAKFYDWFMEERDPTAPFPYGVLESKIGASDRTMSDWYKELGGISYKKYNEFHAWFMLHKDEYELPSYRELARKFNVGDRTLARWINELGGFTHGTSYERQFRKRVEAAKKVLNEAPGYMNRSDLMREVGACPASMRLGNKLIAEIEKENSETARFVKMRTPSRGTPEAIHEFALTFFQRNKRKPTLPDLFYFLETGSYNSKKRLRDGKYIRDSRRARDKVQKYFEEGKLDERLFVIGASEANRVEQTYKEKEVVRHYTGGRKTRPKEWLDSIKENNGFGFDFTGQYWERYYQLWLLKRAGYDATVLPVPKKGVSCEPISL